MSQQQINQQIMAPVNKAIMEDYAKSAIAVGGTVGAYSYLTSANQAFMIPALQSAGTAVVGQYLLAGKGDEIVAAGTAAGMYASCLFLQQMDGSNCMQYSLITGLLTYGAMKFVKPRLPDY